MAGTSCRAHRSRQLLALSLLALGLASGPARADQDQYRRLVACAAYNQFATAVLKAADPKGHKQDIKRHEKATRLNMEMASSMLDPYHVPPRQVLADTQAATQDLVQRFQSGEPGEAIMAEAAASCPDFRFP